MGRRSAELGVLLVGVGGALLGILVTVRVLGRPEALAPPAEAPGALRVEAVAAELMLREARLSRQGVPLVLKASEINGFLTRHVEARRLAVWPIQVRLEQGWVELAGRTSPRRLLTGPATPWAAKILPASVLDIDVWVTLRGRLEASHGQGRLVVERTTVGRQPVPPSWLWRLLGTNPSELLVWRMPRIVERLDVEPGQLVIHTRPVR